ncbi:MAG: flavohemoglobin expression-modulating QEGLA motif protein [SAR324 cluster bacterium]|nr:flavohemoglobin expression-modulating QEGLA motif protein [SAR324 cluster bacterium]
MLELTFEQMQEKIRRGQTFTACTPDGSLLLEIQDYLPYLMVALHGGHAVPPEFEKAYALKGEQRVTEEDPHTDQLARLAPISLVAQDSRYFYDLNRPLDQALYPRDAWGLAIWQGGIPKDLKKEALRRHQQFHDLLKCLAAKLVSTYESVLILDIHSYNSSRQAVGAPLFNLGSHFLNKDKKKLAEFLRRELSKIQMPNLPVTAEFDVVFQGKGYLSQWANSESEQITCIPIEIKKVFCDEEKGELFPLAFEELKKGMADVFSKTALQFSKKTTNLKLYKKRLLVSKGLDEEVLKLDQAFFKMVNNFDLLSHVNPINLESAKKKFLKSRNKSIPVFRYRQLRLDPFLLKRKLFELPIEKIRDPHLQGIYRDSILAFSQKADMLIHLGSREFYYQSLAYFGEPDAMDIANAQFLLHCPEHPKEGTKAFVSPEEAKKMFQAASADLGFSFKVEENRNLVSDALAINQKLLIQLRKGAQFSTQKIQALIHHEAGVHLLTTKNARDQPLKLMSLGLPQNTRTQEGLAILNEYLSGNLTVVRLKELALRVMAVSQMAKGADFIEVFHFLNETQGLEENKAFTLSSRIFRGGGFTKDFLYLNGLISLLKLRQEETNINSLFIGKTSLEYLPVIEQLIERRILVPPKHLPQPFLHPSEGDQIINFLIQGIKCA